MKKRDTHDDGTGPCTGTERKYGKLLRAVVIGLLTAGGLGGGSFGSFKGYQALADTKAVAQTAKSEAKEAKAEVRAVAQMAQKNASGIESEQKLGKERQETLLREFREMREENQRARERFANVIQSQLTEIKRDVREIRNRP